MKNITIVTPANVEVEYRLAGAGSRLGAFIIDFLIQFAAYLVLVWITVALSGGFFVPEGFGWGINSTVLAVLVVGFFVIYFGYFLVLEYVMNGQTIGKRILGLRVIQDNGEPVNFFNVLIRGFLRSSVDILYVGVFVILFSKKHKRLGDMAAGTIVVSELSEGVSLFSLQQVSWPENFPDRYELSNEENELVQDFLRKRRMLEDGGARLAGKFKEYFDEKETSKKDNIYAAQIETNGPVLRQINNVEHTVSASHVFHHRVQETEATKSKLVQTSITPISQDGL